MNTKVLYSVFKRNFVGYLSNPTGYVFICVFVLLCSVAAFLPDEFFNANLANLDQLNLWFPLIMLVFVPAITMGIWADERRQGTDELLLTIPASDFDIVLGKFKAAVSIYTISLLFSMICNLATLCYLGKPDIGLFACTYLGYWMVGVSMISIGTVASFLTANLTVSYILGAIFCTPFIALRWIDTAPIPEAAARLLKSFSIASQFDLFGRGILTFSGCLYFVMLTATMLYLSMILIGRRHWTANQKAIGIFHFTVRVVSLLVIGLSLCFLFRQHDFRYDMTEEKLSTLSPEAQRLLKEMKPDYPVVIEAFLSPDVPESYVQTRLNILSVLGEIESTCGKNVSVRIHPSRPNTELALLANQRYDIKPQDVVVMSQGRREIKTLFMGISFRCGLRSLTLPFIDRGLSPEYELVHALHGVIKPKKKRVGVLRTDASLLEGMDMSTFQVSPAWQLVEELKKQYTIVEVDPAEPIRDRFDALLAVQPSAMGPQETEHFIDAVRRGQPTVIFEDPTPISVAVAGTASPRRPPSQMMMMMGRQNPKGDISPLWTFLGVTFDGLEAVWQEYLPIRKLPTLPEGLVFLDRSREGTKASTDSASPFNGADPVSANLQYMMIPFPGRIRKTEIPASGESSGLEFTSVLRTFQSPAGTIEIGALQRGLMDESWRRSAATVDGPMDLAVRIRGELPPPPVPPLREGEEPGPPPEAVKIDVLLVADIDLISDSLFTLRRMGSDASAGINMDFDNVTFVLNAIDSVAGDEQFLAIRSRRPKHRTLSKFDENTNEIRVASDRKRQNLQDQFNDQLKAEEEEFKAKIEELEKGLKDGSVNEDEVARKLGAAIMGLQKRLTAGKEKIERELNIELEKTDVELNENIQRIQRRYKVQAVVFPPILPLLIGIVVFFVRRLRESEGIPQTRRRKS